MLSRGGWHFSVVFLLNVFDKPGLAEQRKKGTPLESIYIYIYTVYTTVAGGWDGPGDEVFGNHTD